MRSIQCRGLRSRRGPASRRPPVQGPEPQALRLLSPGSNHLGGGGEGACGLSVSGGAQAGQGLQGQGSSGARPRGGGAGGCWEAAHCLGRA